MCEEVMKIRKNGHDIRFRKKQLQKKENCGIIKVQILHTGMYGFCKPFESRDGLLFENRLHAEKESGKRMENRLCAYFGEKGLNGKPAKIARRTRDERRKSMCGIVGYIGRDQAVPVLLRGLKRLEYRGYDSAGVALLTETGTRIEKAPGRVDDLQNELNALPSDALLGSVGIAHTRWSTHGAPTKENAHPHRAGGVTIVHNGIVENAHEEKEKLLAIGVVFSSETDSEVIVQRINRAYIARGRGIEHARQAIRDGLDGLRGTWALAILFDDLPDCLFALRKDSPLYIGLGDGETAAASDLSAMPEEIDRYQIPEEGEIALLTRDGACIWNAEDRDITAEKPIYPVQFRAKDAELGGYPHFMRKEIAEEPGVIARLISRHLTDDTKAIFREELPKLDQIKGIHLVGCGSAMHAGMLGCGFIESMARIPVRVHVASEFRYADPILSPGELVIVISQSGETADSLAALRLAKQRGIPVCAIVNVVGSTMYREADSVLCTEAGQEIAVATTKAFAAQVTVLALLALRLAAERGTLSEHTLSERVTELRALGAACEQVNALFPQLESLAQKWKNAEHCFFIGRGRDYALSMEGALKLKEISYIHCEAYPAGELKHGTISLITEGVPCIVAATDRALYEKTLSGAKEIRARGAKILMLVKHASAVPEDVADAIVRLPDIADWLMPLPGVIALQYFAYCTALARGCDVDKPRNLAKSVTVE